MTSMRRRGLLLASLLILSAGQGCGSDAVVEPDPVLDDFVGDWDASTMVVTSVQNPSLSVDVIEAGASFFLNVQPSGGYTSSLTFEGLSRTELGRLEVEGERLLFFVEIPSPRVDTAFYELDGDRLDLEGRTIFDFDLNGIPEEAELEATLVR